MTKDRSHDGLFAQACSDWDNGKYELAFSKFKELVAAGDASAMINLGVFYENGLCCAVDLDKARRCYQACWKQSRSTAACMNLALTYWKSSKYRRAYYWIDKAVRHGDGDAMLQKANWLMSRSQNSKTKKVVIYLARQAMMSSFITPDGKSQAKKLIKSLDFDT
jgi:TPR repeat protein